MAIEVFHNFKNNKKAKGLEHLAQFDKLLIMRRGKDKKNLIDLFGVIEHGVEVVFLLTADDSSGNCVRTVNNVSWLTELELECLWNIVDSYSFGYEHVSRNYFNYQIGEAEISEDSDNIKLLKKVARLDNFGNS